MKIIKHYLAKEVYTMMLVVIVVLLLIFSSHQFVRYLHVAASGHLPGHGIKILLLLQLPILSATLLPVSLFLAILLAYGRLYADSEMTVLFASGISPQNLLKITLNFAITITILVALLALWINPKIYNYSDRIVAGAVTTTALDMATPNSFTTIAKDKLIFYVDDISHKKENFSRVFVATQPDSNDPLTKYSVVMANNAYQKIDPKTGNLYIVLTDGYRYVGTPGAKDYEMIKYDEYALQIQQDVDSWQADASSIPTLKLWHKRADKLAAAELQWRIALPLSVLILTLIAVPLSKIKPKHGRYAKLIPAILLYITYANFLFLAKAWLKNGTLSPMLGMWWVHGIMLSIALFLYFITNK